MSVRQGVNTIAGSGYTKSEVNTLLAGKADTALSNITATGKEVCANMAMPSGRYINLTLGSSGSTYTAPADGYFITRGTANAAGGYCVLSNEAIQMTNNPVAFSAGGGVSAFLPVKKGDVVYIWYGYYTSTHFRFIYANGAQ